MNSQNEEIEINLREIFQLICRHLPVLFLVTLLSSVIAGVISVYVLTPMYTSTAKMYILAKSDAMVSLSDLQLGSSLANDYEELIKSRPVVEEVTDNLNLPDSYAQMREKMVVTNPENTRIIQIQIVYQDPVLAKNIANEFVKVSQKKISQIMKIEEPTIVEEAIEAAGQSSPDNKKNILLGGLIGCFIAIVFLVIRELFNDTIQTAEDVEKFLGLHTLAAVPQEGGTDNSEKKQKKLSGVRKGK